MNPKDYYFKFGHDGTNYYVVITSKTIFDTHGVVDDDSEEPACIPPAYSQLAESVYEYVGSRDDARADLLARGFIENLQLDV